MRKITIGQFEVVSDENNRSLIISSRILYKSEFEDFFQKIDEYLQSTAIKSVLLTYDLNSQEPGKESIFLANFLKIEEMLNKNQVILEFIFLMDNQSTSHNFFNLSHIRGDARSKSILQLAMEISEMGKPYNGNRPKL